MVLAAFLGAVVGALVGELIRELIDRAHKVPRDLAGKPYDREN